MSCDHCINGVSSMHVWNLFQFRMAVAPLSGRQTDESRQTDERQCFQDVVRVFSE